MATETKQIPSTMSKENEEAQKKLSKLDDDDEYDYITVPPDGGFGWVVLVACFVSRFFVVVFENLIEMISVFS